MTTIVWDNRFADGTPVASTTASGAAINLADFRPYTSWKPSTIPATVTIDCITAHSADTLGIFNHDLFDGRYAVEVRGSVDNFVASNVLVKTYIPTSNVPFLTTFPSASYRYWRLSIVDWASLGQATRNWFGMTTLGSDVYACEYGGDIYKQTGGGGNFIALGQTSRNWIGMTTLGSDVYASAYGGDIYKQTGGAGNFIALGQAPQAWRGMTTLGSDVYACVNGGDIYKQTGGTGNFIALGQASLNWVGMNTFGSDVYACVYGGDIYKQTGGAGNFIALGQTPRNWVDMTTLGSDVYASVNGGDIYKQTGGTGNFTALGQTSRIWGGMTTLGSDVYVSIYDGTAPTEGGIYKKSVSTITTAPTLTVVALGVGLPLEVGVLMGFDPLARTVYGQTNISEQGLPLGKAVMFEQWSQSVSVPASNTWLRNTFLPAWKAHLRGNPCLFAFDPTTYPDEVYLVEVEGNVTMPSISADYSMLNMTVKGVALP